MSGIRRIAYSGSIPSTGTRDDKPSEVADHAPDAPEPFDGAGFTHVPGLTKGERVLAEFKLKKRLVNGVPQL